MSSLAACGDTTWLGASSPGTQISRGWAVCVAATRLEISKELSNSKHQTDFKFNLKLQPLIFRNISPALKVQVLLPQEYKSIPKSCCWALRRGVSWLSKSLLEIKAKNPQNCYFDCCLCIDPNPTFGTEGFLKLCCCFWLCGSISWEQQTEEEGWAQCPETQEIAPMSKFQEEGFWGIEGYNLQVRSR